jgi:hypothetical protein
LRFGKIARGSDNLRTVRRQCARGLHPEACRDTGDEHPFSGQIDALQHLVRRRGGSKNIAHGQILAVFHNTLSLDLARVV